FLREMTMVLGKFRAYLGRADTYASLRKENPFGPRAPIVCFCAEFCFHESVPNYSGGLGILSGDHCKSASDLGLNFIGVTLLYKHGYFRQLINKEGLTDSVPLHKN